MNKKTIVKIFVLVFIIGFLFLIYFVFAQLSPEQIIENQDLIELEKRDAYNILNRLNQEFADSFINLTSSSGYFDIKEQAILVVLKEAFEINSMQYILTSLGKDGIEFTLKIANLIISKDPSLIIGEIEKMSADQAKNYAMDWLLQKEMKVSKGNLDISYPALVGGWEQVIFPYIIVYQPVNLEQGNVAIGIYSSEIIKTPEVSPKYPWEGGINELPPFIIEITGEVEKNDIGWGGAYRWIKEPEINIIFDQPVPKFEFKEPTIFEKIGTYFNKARVVLSKIKEFGQDVFDGIFSFISRPDSFEASVTPGIDYLNQNEEPEQELSEIIKDELTEKGLERILTQPETLSEDELEQFEEMLDDIAERIDILSQQIAGLVDIKEQENGLVFVETTTGKIELASEIIYKSPEQFPNNETNNRNEQDKKTITTKTKSSSGSGGSPATSYCSLIGLGQASMDKVVFNEIAWMGTNDSSNDEWIKIKNLTSNQIDLSNWQILDKDGQIKIIFGQANIPANGFYLLERTDDNSFPGAVADLIYTGALNDTDEALYLFDKNCLLQDKVTADPDWPGGNKENKTPMKRNQDLTWYSEPEPEPAPPSDGAPEGEPEGSQQIIINEIAWMGTKASSTDEWLELYNPNQEPVDLLDWELRFYPVGVVEPRITVFSSTIESTTPSIDGLSYFLLERTDDNAISDVKSDYIFTGALNDEGGILELRDNQGNLVDKLDCSNDWLAGDKGKKVSMERFGSNKWANNNLIIRQGLDAQGNKIWGTPNVQNSINPPTEILKQLPFDEFDEITLAIESSPYIVRINLEVPEGKILKIEPGVVLKFYDNYKGLLINGTLKAVGTENEKIIFTSFSDNPYPGSWDQIYFSETSKDSELNNVIVQYAGGGYGTPCSPDMAGIWVEQSSIILKNSIVEKNQYSGLSLVNSSSLIDNVQILDNSVCYNQYGGAGIEVSAGTPVIKNSLFKNNIAGIFIDDLASPIIENNNFEENKKAVYLLKGSPYFAGNQAINNEINGVFIYGEISQDTVWEADLPYVISSNLNVFPDVVFTIKPGTIVKFYDNYGRIDVQGTLKAIGTENEKIIFTSFSDNSYPGSWDQIYFSETSKDSELNNVIVQYAGGGYGTPCSPDMAGIWVEQSSIILKNSIVEKNQYNGLYLVDSSSLIDNVQFLDNTVCWGTAGPGQQSYGGSGLVVSGGSPGIKNSTFKKHRYAINIRDGGVPILENLIFGTGGEANECNIFQESQCIDSVPTP